MWFVNCRRWQRSRNLGYYRESPYARSNAFDDVLLILIHTIGIVFDICFAPADGAVSKPGGIQAFIHAISTPAYPPPTYHPPLASSAQQAQQGRARAAVREGGRDRAFLSYPALFKHLAFDGSFLHGVPEPMQRESCPSEKDCGRPADRLGGGDIKRDSSPVPSFCDKSGPRHAGETGPEPAREASTKRSSASFLMCLVLVKSNSGVVLPVHMY